MWLLTRLWKWKITSWILYAYRTSCPRLCIFNIEGSPWLSYCQITFSKLCSPSGVPVLQTWPYEAKSMCATLVTISATFPVQDCFARVQGTEHPGYITKLVNGYSPARTFRPSSQNLLCVLAPGRTNFYSKRTFSIAVLKIWHNLPSNIRFMTFLSQFKGTSVFFFFKKT